MISRIVRRTADVLAIVVVATWPPTTLQSKEQKSKFPAQVLIIRHGEKPPENAKSVDLNAQGKERADALPNLFKASTTRPSPFPTPDFIFATKNTKHSFRPLETVMPLAKKLNQPINANYADEEYAKLADEILKNPKYAGKTALISWHHGMIPQLAEKLHATGMPEHWKGTVFDRVWQITYDKEGAATFQDLPQHLLPHDSEK
jgi:hypothetical protein